MRGYLSNGWPNMPQRPGRRSSHLPVCHSCQPSWRERAARGKPHEHQFSGRVDPLLEADLLPQLGGTLQRRWLRQGADHWTLRACRLRVGNKNESLDRGMLSDFCVLDQIIWLLEKDNAAGEPCHDASCWLRDVRIGQGIGSFVNV